MFQKRWIVMALLFSFGAHADVSFEEKQNRVEFLEELSKSATSMNIEAYRRELTYEKQGLSAKERASNEANLLAEKIKNQIGKAYDASLELHGDANQAVAEIREAIEKDLELADPSLREELKILAFEALENVQKGSSHTETDLTNVENALMKGVKDRMEFLNVEGENDLTAMLADPTGPSVNTNRDSERKSYNNKGEVLASLVSDRDSIRWLNGAGVTLKSTSLTKYESKINLQVKVAFLGVEVEAGPVITFKREYNTNVNIMAEGLNPVLLPDGNFDFYVRDRANRIVKKGNQNQKRFVNFACESQLDFESEYTGEGGFSMAGVGAKASVSKKFVNSVNLSSRRIALPEYIGGKTVTYKALTSLCHIDFLNTRITNNLTVAGSLNVMMKNVVAGLRFSHPKTKCATDNHCINWYNREVLPLVRIGNYPRCGEEPREKYRACVLRGLKGQNCAIYDKTGKRVSDGMFEFVCDKGLKCVQTQEAGWFKNFDIYQYAKGKCMPINPRTYISPLARVITVDLR